MERCPGCSGRKGCVTLLANHVMDIGIVTSLFPANQNVHIFDSRKVEGLVDRP